MKCSDNSFELTEHAKNRLKERVIDEKEVEETLNNPVMTYFDILTGYSVCIGPRKKAGHWLIVVYEKRDELKRVISVLDTSNIEKIVSAIGR
ncbi:MAG: DUF4258 domain-containing protein [Candidatus Korarchaeum sp.]|nr:DUF4258 domain-containing protein [Candidatus Korarchaeum sp.]